MTTPAEFKALCLEALRSGEYQQTTGCLRNDEGFCCLGVVTDVAIKNKLVPYDWRDPDGATSEYHILDTNGDIRTGALPNSVRVLLGVDSCDPLVSTCFRNEDGNSLHTLSSCNDQEGLTFEQIANLIEEQL